MTELALSRPKKLDHVDTIRYEVDMLRHAVSLLAEQKLTGRDAWSYLEVFLLHYRNLIEFLGKGNPSETDLHVTTFWRVAGLAEPTNLKDMHERGHILWERYEPKDNLGGGRISQYLQHCTTKRVDPKDWPVTAMMNEIEPLLKEIEKHLVTSNGLMAPVPPVQDLSYFSASTV
jgi:hypothetical protein